MFLYTNKKKQIKKIDIIKLLFEIDQMIYYTNSEAVKQKLKIVKEKINEL